MLTTFLLAASTRIPSSTGKIVGTTEATSPIPSRKPTLPVTSRPSSLKKACENIKRYNFQLVMSNPICHLIVLFSTSQCKKLASTGYCSSNKEWMKKFCPVTCRFCNENGPCVDKKDDCARLKSNGLCATNS